ncbi:MAG TPA: dipeptidase [Geminicoccaceae bacterium]|nr:dipeptidase [Geminicoccaceae bacterium]
MGEREPGGRRAGTPEQGTADVEAYLAAQADRYVAELCAFCAIPSVSTQRAHRQDVARAARFVADRLARAGLADVEVHPTAGHPVVTGAWRGDDRAPTVLVYGHYDVQPPEPLDLWRSPPFEASLRDDRLYARGASDDKGPLLIPIVVAEAFLALRGRLPVNLKFVVEGEEECGSEHLEEALAALGDRVAADLVLSADGAMWRPDLPSVTVAGRGLLALELTVEGAAKDLHSGRHGGSAPNPLTAIARLVASLHDAAGRVAVEGFYDGARPPDPALLRTVANVGFHSARYFADLGAPCPARLPSGAELLTRQWLEPTLELNGLVGGYGGEGTKTVIPARAAAKITCRLVAGQQPDRVFAAIDAHLQRHCPDGFRLRVTRQGRGCAAFALPPELPALGVIEHVLTGIYGRPPLRVAMGATLPVADIFRRRLGAETLFFSFATADEDYHAPNEFFRLSSFRNGLVAWARALAALADDGPRAPDDRSPEGTGSPGRAMPAD